MSMVGTFWATPHYCATCGDRLDCDEMSVVTRLAMPKGVTDEQLEEAIRRARDAEHRAPLRGLDRLICLHVADLWAGLEGRERLSEDQRAVLGRALGRLGARILEIHESCAEGIPTPNVSTLVTPRWEELWREGLL